MFRVDFLRWARAELDVDLSEELPLLSVPTLVMTYQEHGRLWLGTSPTASERLCRLIPGSKSLTVANMQDMWDSIVDFSRACHGVGN